VDHEHIIMVGVMKLLEMLPPQPTPYHYSTTSPPGPRTGTSSPQSTSGVVACAFDLGVRGSKNAAIHVRR
jgi:hypothetical protein